MSLSPERAGRLTASVFASAIGVGYDSRQKLWRQLTGREERFAGNAATQWGTNNESNAITRYEVATGDIVEMCGDRQRFFIHPEHDWIGCTPDGFASGRVIEAKCPASMQLYRMVPDHYMPQIQGQMAITGYKSAHFVCWTPYEFEVWEVDKDEEYWASCFDLLSDFWGCIKSDTEPKRKKKPDLPSVIYRRII